MEAKIKQVMSKLTDHQRELIHLKYSEGFQNNEIAEMLNIDVASVRTLLYRSLKKGAEVVSIMI
jgi:RNA polymerase sigma factor (sigma-70 family)